VVTHHAPSPQSVPSQFRNDPLNPAYASNLEPFIAECGAVLWIHGHIHHRADFTVGGTRVIANPRGYPIEPHTGFDPSFVVEV
jgi:Icc-related predicted phosphoesterase